MWMDELDPKVQKSLNKLLVEVSKNKDLYLLEKNSSKVQMWIALALLNSKIEELSLQRENQKLKKSLKRL
jgi:hypothetical protein